MVVLTSTWLRGGEASISQYQGHGEIRRGKWQDVVSTVTVVLKHASLPEGYGGLSHLQSVTKENRQVWQVAGIPTEVEKS